MQQFKVPKFLGGGIKIFGPLTFKQFIIFGALGGGLILLYYVLPRWLFIICAVLVGGGFVLLFFVKVDGVPLIQLMGPAINYFVSGKMYFWKKKEVPMPMKIVKKEIKKTKKESILKISPKSQIKKLMSEIELGKK